MVVWGYVCGFTDTCAWCGFCQRLRVTRDDHLYVSPISAQPLKDRSKSARRSWVVLEDAKGAFGPIFYFHAVFGKILAK